MTDKQIIEMAKEAKLPHYWETGDIVRFDEVRHFAKLVAQHERLMCSKFLQETINPLKTEYINQIEEGIWND